ncbi:MAG: DUF4190 domain-containing protein [Akkermansiaceae bacterium]
MNSTPPPIPPNRDSIGQDAGVRLLIPVGRSVWAIAAGYFGLLSVLLIFGPPALVCGLVAIADIRKSKLGPNPKHGMVRAIFGIVMGTLGTLIGVYVLIANFI